MKHLDQICAEINQNGKFKCRTQLSLETRKEIYEVLLKANVTIPLNFDIFLIREKAGIRAHFLLLRKNTSRNKKRLLFQENFVLVVKKKYLQIDA